MARSNIARRKVVLALGTGSIALLSGTYLATDDAKALELGVTSLDIPEQTIASPDAPGSIPLGIEGDYRVESNVAPDELRITPIVGVQGSVMGPHEYPPMAYSIDSKSATDTFGFEVDLLALSALRDVFPETAGESASRTLDVSLQAVVVSGGDVIGEAAVEETFPLVIEHEAASAEVSIRAEGFVGE